MKLRTLTLLVIECLSALAVAYGIYQQQSFENLHVQIKVKTQSADLYQLFYETGKGFTEEQSIKISVPPSQDFQNIRFTIPIKTKDIAGFRIDPGSHTKDFEIKEILIGTKGEIFSLSPSSIPAHFIDHNHIASIQVSSEILRITTSGNDPQLVYTGDILDRIHTSISQWTRIIWVCLSFLLLTILYFLRKNIIAFLGKTRLYTDTNYRFCVLFIAIISIPLSQMMFQYLPETPLNEKRDLSELPSLTMLKKISGWNDYLQSFEDFFNDHYGLRPFLIRANSAMEIKYFHISPTANVVLGKDGWLFYDAPDEGVNLKDFYGDALFTDRELTIIKSNLGMLQKKLSKQHIDLMIIVTPNKHTIYNEYLPSSMQKQKGTETRADQISTLVREMNIHYVDTRQSLLEAKGQYAYPLYYKTDTHWNKLGAFIGFQEIMKSVSSLGYTTNNISPENTLNIEPQEIACQCDLATMVSFDNYQNEIEPLIHVDTHYISEEKSDLRYHDAYGNYLVTRLPDQRYPKVILYRDSFARSLIPYLSESFSQVSYIWSRKIDFNLIQKERPDIVMIQFAERYSDILLNIPFE